MSCLNKYHRLQAYGKAVVPQSSMIDAAQSVVSVLDAGNIAMSAPWATTGDATALVGTEINLHI